MRHPIVLTLLLLLVFGSSSLQAQLYGEEEEPEDQQYATSADDDDYYEYVDEILKEEQEHYGEADGGDEDDPYFDEDAARLKEEDAQRLRREEEERIQREQAEKVRQQREAAFEKELSRMNAEQAKEALRQKKRDAKIVKRILRAAKHGNLYATLGLFYKEIRIPSKSIGIFGRFKFTIPGLTLFHISPKAIRKAYRKRSLQVHPDRNRDGRAEEAFIALENAAAILSDETLREEYDEKLRAMRKQRRKEIQDVATKAIDGTFRVTGRTVTVVRKVLGPFAYPTFVIVTLLV